MNEVVDAVVPDVPWRKAWDAVFACRTEIDASTGCILWTGGRSGTGYGALWVAGTQVYAHRLAFEVTHGPIPTGLVVRHTCDVPRCINPEHLELGTKADNARDAMVRGRLHTKLSDAQVSVVFGMAMLRRSRKDIAAEFNVSVSQVSAILKAKGRTESVSLELDKQLLAHGGTRDEHGDVWGGALPDGPLIDLPDGPMPPTG